MSKQDLRRAVAKFLAADASDLGKLNFIRRLVALAREIGRNREISANDRDAAIRLIKDQSPHRSWNSARISDARLVFKRYQHFDEVVGDLEKAGTPFDWHDVVAGLRAQRDGRSYAARKQSDMSALREKLSNVASSCGMTLEGFRTSPDRVTVVFATTKKKSRRPGN